MNITNTSVLNKTQKIEIDLLEKGIAGINLTAVTGEISDVATSENDDNQHYGNIPTQINHEVIDDDEVEEEGEPEKIPYEPVDQSWRNSTIEIWRYSKKYPGYQASTFGRIYTPFNHFVQADPTPDGYIRCFIVQSNGKRKNEGVHRIVAECFCDNPENKPYVDHINGIRHDNRAVNLRWCTPSENNLNRNFESKPRSTCISVIQYDLNRNEVKRWNSIADVAEYYGGNSISSYIDKPLIYQGFYWEREKQVEVLPGELWAVVNYEGNSVPVSSEGRVKRSNGRITYGSKNSGGYMEFFYNGIRILVHRIVMMAKDPRNSYDGLVVDHINRIKDDNRISNLRWCTQQENVQYSFETDDKSRFDKIKTPVSVYDLNGKLLHSFDFMIEASETMKVQNSHIWECCNRIRPSANGYMFRYASENEAKDICQIEYGYHTRAVSQYTLEGSFIRNFPSLSEAERQTGIYHSQIGDCCKGKENQQVDFSGFIMILQQEIIKILVKGKVMPPEKSQSMIFLVILSEHMIL